MKDADFRNMSIYDLCQLIVVAQVENFFAHDWGCPADIKDIFDEHSGLQKDDPARDAYYDNCFWADKKAERVATSALNELMRRPDAVFEVRGERTVPILEFPDGDVLGIVPRKRGDSWVF